MGFEEYAALVLQELKQVFDRMDEDRVRPLLRAIREAERIFVLGVGREGLSARAFAMRLMHLGKQAYWIWDDTTPGIRKGDLLLCASGSGEIGHEVYICSRAKEKGARLALVTAAPEGTLQEMADVSVILPAEAFRARGDMVPTKQIMGNLFEQSLLLFFDIVSMMLKAEWDVSDGEMEERHRNVE